MKVLAILATLLLLLASGSAVQAKKHRKYYTLWVTGYDLTGRMANGQYTFPGACAADPRVFTRGTKVHIPKLHRTCTVLDTGVFGPRLDIWFPTAAQCYAVTGSYQAYVVQN